MLCFGGLQLLPATYPLAISVTHQLILGGGCRGKDRGFGLFVAFLHLFIFFYSFLIFLQMQIGRSESEKENSSWKVLQIVGGSGDWGSVKFFMLSYFLPI